jgi:hypothetical protein
MYRSVGLQTYRAALLRALSTFPWDVLKTDLQKTVINCDSRRRR